MDAAAKLKYEMRAVGGIALQERRGRHRNVQEEDKHCSKCVSGNAHED